VFRTKYVGRAMQVNTQAAFYCESMCVRYVLDEVVVQRATQYSILINNVRAMQPAAISLSREITSLWWQAAQQSIVDKICTAWSAIAQLKVLC